MHEVRSEDPDVTREFFAQLCDWRAASEGDCPGYTFMDTGVHSKSRNSSLSTVQSLDGSSPVYGSSSTL